MARGAKGRRSAPLEDGVEDLGSSDEEPRPEESGAKEQDDADVVGETALALVLDEDEVPLVAAVEGVAEKDDGLKTGELKAGYDRCRICNKGFLISKMFNNGSKRWPSRRDYACHNAAIRLENASKVDDPNNEKRSALRKLKRDKQQFALKVLELVAEQQEKGLGQRELCKEFLERMVVGMRVTTRQGIVMLDEAGWCCYQRNFRNASDAEAKESWLVAKNNPDHPRETVDLILFLGQKMAKEIIQDNFVEQNREIRAKPLQLQAEQDHRRGYMSALSLSQASPIESVFQTVGGDLLRSGPRMALQSGAFLGMPAEPATEDVESCGGRSDAEDSDEDVVDAASASAKPSCGRKSKRAGSSDGASAAKRPKKCAPPPKVTGAALLVQRQRASAACTAVGKLLQAVLKEFVKIEKGPRWALLTNTELELFALKDRKDKLQACAKDLTEMAGALKLAKTSTLAEAVERTDFLCQTCTSFHEECTVVFQQMVVATKVCAEEDQKAKREGKKSQRKNTQQVVVDFLTTVAQPVLTPLGILLDDRTKFTTLEAVDLPFNFTRATIAMKSSNAAAALLPAVEPFKAMIEDKAAKLLEHLKANAELTGNMVMLSVSKLTAEEKEFAIDASRFESWFTDDDEVPKDLMVPEKLDTLSEPWLISVRRPKLLSGPSAIPMAGVGGFFQVVSGTCFVMLVSTEMEPDAVHMSKWLLQDIDARRLKRLGDRAPTVLLQVGDFLWSPPGFCPYIVGCGDAGPCILFWRPLATPFFKSMLWCKDNVGPAVKQAIAAQMKAKNKAWQNLQGFSAWMAVE
jgi:hypothetical protein